MRRKPTLSLCMIVKNEEDQIGSCLQSVKGIVDEVIIVDTGSTDRTLDIAAQYSAQIYRIAWENNFSQARNKSLEHATGDYILVLDADEVLDSAEPLWKALSQQKDYYTVSVRNYFSNGSTKQAALVRLFRNHRDITYTGRIHEQLTIDPTKHQGGSSGILVHHYGYKQDIYEAKGKNERNYQLLEQELTENPSYFAYYNMGKQHKMARKWDEALGAFMKARESAPDDAAKSVMLDLDYQIPECLLLMNRETEALRDLVEGRSRFPDNVDLYFLSGRCFYQLGDTKDAEQFFRRCLDLKEDSSLISREGAGSYLSRLFLAHLDDSQGGLAEALAGAFEAVRMGPHFAQSLDFALLLTNKARLDKAQTERLLHDNGLNDGDRNQKWTAQALYRSRHPLMIRYLSQYGLNADPSMQAIACLYDKQYEKARDIWSECEVAPDSGTDIILCALLLRDRQLLRKGIREAGLNDEFGPELISAMAARQQLNHTSVTLSRLFLRLIPALLLLRESELFQYVTSCLLRQKPAEQCELCRQLISYQYYDQATQVLMRLLQQHPDHAEALELLGDVMVRKQKWKEASTAYETAQLYNIRYSSAEKLHDVYLKLGDHSGMMKVKDTIRSHFPWVIWAKR